MGINNFLIFPESENYFSRLRKIFSETRIEGSRIYLRALTETDIDETYLSFFRDETHIQFMYQSKRQITLEQLRSELKNGQETGNFHLYAVVDKATQQVIGNIRVGIMTHVHKISDLAIFIGHPQFIGKGFAKEAIELGNRICFDIYDFRKLHGGMFAENMASVKAYLKTGWVIEGVLKAQYWVKDQPMDRYCVACFNPRYFDKDTLQSLAQKSNEYLHQIESKGSVHQ